MIDIAETSQNVQQLAARRTARCHCGNTLSNYLKAQAVAFVEIQNRVSVPFH
jgi:hypothetical protein